MAAHDQLARLHIAQLRHDARPSATTITASMRCWSTSTQRPFTRTCVRLFVVE